MSESELLDVIRLNGSYEVVSLDGEYTARPLVAGEIIISAQSHLECKEYFCSKSQVDL